MNSIPVADAELLPSMRLDGYAVVVTGAGRGIGRGSALALAAAGADVVLISRTEAELDATAAEIERLGQSAWPMVCDVTNPDAVTRAIEAVDHVDVLVNAAGSNIPEPFLDVTTDHFDRLLAVNVKGTFLVAQAVAQRMVDAASGGSIINISSQMGRVGAPNRSVYCATKHAVEGLTRALAVELAPHGIRVNAVAPTFIRTAMTEPYLADQRFLADTLSRIPLGRVGEVRDVVGAIVFLSSPSAALVTGESLLIDGGWTAQ